VGYPSSTGSNRLVDVIATIMTQAGDRQEQIAGFHLAAVGGQAGEDHQVTLPLWKELLQLDHPRPSGRSGLGSSTCCSSLRLSGVMFSRRRASDIRPPNAGAATIPP